MKLDHTFVSKLKTTLDIVYNDFMDEVEKADPKVWNVDALFDRSKDTVELDMLITKDGSSVMVEGIFKKDVYYMKEVQWIIKTDGYIVDIERLKLSYFNIKYPSSKYYFFKFNWNDFVKSMIQSCLYIDLGNYGCLYRVAYGENTKEIIE